MKKKLEIFFLHRRKIRKTLLIMKLSLFLVLGLIINVSASVNAQKKINISIEESSLEKFIWQLEDKTDLVFFYNVDQIADIKVEKLDLKQKTVPQILDLVLKGTKIEYKTKHNVIVLTQKRYVNKVEQDFKVRTLSGKVVDCNKQPLPGVSVVIKGTTTGVSTNVEGEFFIKTEDKPGLVLIFSFVGMKDQEVKVTKQNKYQVVMCEDTENIEEIVVTGYQKIKKERMTGSVKTITAAAIKNKGVTTLDEILEGNIAGLTSISSGRPGEDANITIRGVNSLTGDIRPIWIVDGMPLQGELPSVNNIQSSILTSGIGNISPEDIKSITVLKDAAATAIYGSRAANGVIVIETKSGHVGKSFFNFSANYSITEKPESSIKMMNTLEKIKYEQQLYKDVRRIEGLSENGFGRVYDIEYLVDYGHISREEGDRRIAELAKVNTDWFDKVFRVAQTQNYSFSMSGGSEKTQYYASTNYSTEEGVIPNNKYENMGLNLRLTHNPNKKIRISFGLNSNVRKNRESASTVNPLQYAMYANPYERLYNQDGSDAYDLSYNTKLSKIREGFAWGKFNILHDLNNNTKKNVYLNTSANIKFEYEVIPGLMFTSHGVVNYNSNHTKTIEKPNTYTNYIKNWYRLQQELTHDKVNGSITETTGRSEGYTFRNTLQYSKEINETHFINVFGGQEISQRKTNNFSNFLPVFDNVHYIAGYPEFKTDDKISNISLGTLGSTGRSEKKFSSFFGNASYSYNDKYIASGAIRYDGADIIGNKNLFSPLWNVSLRWNLHNEDFMSSYSFIDILSLKGGFGYTGSIDNNAYPWLMLNYGSTKKYNDILVPYNYTLPNPNIRWQKKKDRNIGFELSLLKRRLVLDVSYYNNITGDVLDLRKLPLSSGRETVKENVADIVNKGWEIELSTTNIKTNDLTWITRFNIAINKNEIQTAYYKKLKDVPISQKSGTYVEGYPVNAWYGFKFAGINPDNGETLIYDDKGEKFSTENLTRTVDDVTPPTLSYLGEKTPPVVGGISSIINYKNFVLNINMEFKTGHKIKSFNTIGAVNSKNRYITDKYRWREYGDITNIPATKGYSSAYDRYNYDIKLEKGDYLRCNLISLAYKFDNNLLKKIGLSNSRISFNVRNVFTLTKYNGIDPSLMGSFGYPNSRKYSIALNLGF